MKLYGIFFSDGDLYFGWLQQDSGNGRCEAATFDEDDLDRAHAQIVAEAAADEKTVFAVLPINATKKQIEAVHTQALDHHIERTKKKLAALKARRRSA